MNPLASSTTTLIAHALGWTLLHFFWQGALVALLLACVLALLSGRSPQPRYLAACAALVLMAILPLITFIRVITAQSSATHPIVISIPLSTAVASHGLSTPPEPLLYRIAAALDRSIATVLAVWLAGVVLLFVRLGIGLAVARRMMSAATQPPPRDLLHVFHRLARRIQVTHPVRLLHSALVQVPTVIGWLRPVVLIPLGCLSGLSPTQVEAILAHELAHIRRHDYLVSVVQSIVEALLFYHPAVWWVSRHIRREREHCCDDLAVKFGGDALTYARALSLLEERRSALPAIALGANGGILIMRIKRLLGSKQSPAASQHAALALLGIVISATAVCIGSAARAQSSWTQQAQPSLSTITVATEDIHGPALPSDNAKVPALPQQPAVGPVMSIAYQRWLDQDVRWDATPAERAAFLRLTSDPERDHFIEQFWQRRNPPNAAPNAARGEHYRRLAYANQHFAAETAGWETDRGHIYIAYGPPNTVDSHPAAAAGDSHPYETWRYSSAPGLGQNIELKFVDVCNCGNYQLQPQPTPTGNSSSSTQQQPSPSTAGGVAKSAIRQVSYKAPAVFPQSQTAASSSPLHVSSHVMQTNIVSKVNPIYPPDAKTAHVQGAVVLDVIISKDGTVQALRVISGSDELRTSAIDAVRQWTFEPYLLNGEPAEVETTITINYQLDDPADSQSQNDESAAGVVPKKIGGEVSTPVLIYSVPPEFSEQAKKDKVGGTVLIHLWVDEQGRPEHVRVLRGVGKGLDEKAVEAVKQYKFNPAMEGGRPVLVELNTEVNFKIF